MKTWVLLIVAGFFEVVGFALGLKLSEGFMRPWPTAGTVISGGAELLFCRGR